MSKKIDILVIGEGTYPYIRGGVSAWIHQLIRGLPEFNFGVLFIGSRREDYGKKHYEFPENVVYFKEIYIFEKKELPKPRRIKVSQEYYPKIKNIHEIFNTRNYSKLNFNDLIQLIKDFGLDKFLYSDISWEYIADRYIEKYRNQPFIDYFWTVRNIHIPLWELFGIIEDIPDIGLVHSPSTGYAGFLAGLIKITKNVPYILTEHGIYVRERKIDLLTTDWLSYRKLQILSSYEDEKSNLKNLWNNFFEKLGKFCYITSDKILSLYEKARQIQIHFGAPEEKTEVIPNGVDVDRLAGALNKRSREIPKVVGLIGRVVPIKDIKTFIKAMKIVIDKIPEVEGWIVGPTDEDPEYYEECKNLVNVLGIEKNVKFLGFQNILDIFPKISINTLTSISEGMPLSILEGFAAGVPAVTTDVGSCRDLIEGSLNELDKEIGKAGFVCPVANPKEIAKRYLQLLEDDDLWKKCQEAALKRVNTFYTQKAFLDNYRNLYKEALNWQE